MLRGSLDRKATSRFQSHSRWQLFLVPDCSMSTDFWLLYSGFVRVPPLLSCIWVCCWIMYKAPQTPTKLLPQGPSRDAVPENSLTIYSIGFSLTISITAWFVDSHGPVISNKRLRGAVQLIQACIDFYSSRNALSFRCLDIILDWTWRAALKRIWEATNTPSTILLGQEPRQDIGRVLVRFHSRQLAENQFLATLPCPCCILWCLCKDGRVSVLAFDPTFHPKRDLSSLPEFPSCS